MNTKLRKKAKNKIEFQGDEYFTSTKEYEKC